MRFEEYAKRVPGILKEYRQRRGYSQEYLADKLLNMSKDAYARYEQGKNVLTLDKLFSLCEIYNVTPNILLGYEDNSRINFICEMYGISYRTVDGNKVKVTFSERKNDPDYIISKPGFQELLFDVQESVNDVLDRDYNEIKTMEKYIFQLMLAGRITSYNYSLNNKGADFWDAVMDSIKHMKYDSAKDDIKHIKKDSVKDGDK